MLTAILACAWIVAFFVAAFVGLVLRDDHGYDEDRAFFPALTIVTLGAYALVCYVERQRSRLPRARVRK